MALRSVPTDDQLADVMLFRRRPGDPKERYVTAAFLAERWDVSTRTIRRYRKEHGLPSVKKPNGTRRYPLSQADAWFATQ